jgi:hypothetical protein
MMRGLLQTRRLQVITAIVMMVCFLALLIPHAGSNGPFVTCVLLFPVFLFGLLDIQQVLRNAVRADETFLPQAPVRSALFQRPPPAFD